MIVTAPDRTWSDLRTILTTILGNAVHPRLTIEKDRTGRTTLRGAAGERHGDSGSVIAIACTTPFGIMKEGIWQFTVRDFMRTRIRLSAGPARVKIYRFRPAMIRGKDGRGIVAVARTPHVTILHHAFGEWSPLLDPATLADTVTVSTGVSTRRNAWRVGFGPHVAMGPDTDQAILFCQDRCDPISVPATPVATKVAWKYLSRVATLLRSPFGKTVTAVTFGVGQDLPLCLTLEGAVEVTYTIAPYVDGTATRALYE